MMFDGKARQYSRTLAICENLQFIYCRQRNEAGVMFGKQRLLNILYFIRLADKIHDGHNHFTDAALFE